MARVFSKLFLAKVVSVAGLMLNSPEMNELSSQKLRCFCLEVFSSPGKCVIGALTCFINKGFLDATVFV